MTTTQSIATGDRIYATEAIKLSNGETVAAGAEGVVADVIDDIACDLLIEWDAGFMSGADSGSVALIEPTVTEHDDHFGGNWNA